MTTSLCNRLGVTSWVFIVDDENRALAKERQKKDNHNLSEWMVRSNCMARSPALIPFSPPAILFLQATLSVSLVSLSLYLHPAHPSERSIPPNTSCP